MSMNSNTAYLRLTRFATFKKHGTFGVLTFNGVPFCVTLEPADNDNRNNISSIPSGMYECERHSGTRYKNTWEVMDVIGRTKILIHGGNIDTHTKGCILLAEHYGKLRGDLAVLNSGNTIRKFLRMTEGCNKLHLTIVEAY